MNGLIVLLSITLVCGFFYLFGFWIISMVMEEKDKRLNFLTVYSVLLIGVYLLTVITNREYIFDNPYPSYF